MPARCCRSPTDHPPGLTTYDAKDPATSFPPIEPLLPARGRAERPDRAGRRRRLRSLERLRWPDQHAHRGATGRERAQVQPLPHDCPVLADAPGAPHGTEPPLGWDGGRHRDRDLGPGLQLRPPEHLRAARRDAQAERLLDGAVRQVPRGAGLGDEPDGAVHRVAHRRGRSRSSTASSAARRTSGDRRCTTARSRSSRRRPRRRATTSPRT